MAMKRKREYLEVEGSTTTGKRRSSRLARRSNISVEEMEEAFVSEAMGTSSVKAAGTSSRTKTKTKVADNGNNIDLATFPTRVKSEWKVGAHVSCAGGIENSVLNAAKIGANAFALFLKSQRKWSSPPLSEESIASFKMRMREFSYDPKHVIPHGNYLINLGNPDDEKRERSYQCFLDDLKRCELLGLEQCNFHPGSTVGTAERAVSIQHIAQCINRYHRETPGSKVVAVLENMAGAGNVIGSDFAELGEIIRQVDDKTRVGVCIDTCHMFSAGYDIRTKEGWDAALQALDNHVGLKHLRGMHINDSKTVCGSKKDRHENVGLGHLSLRAFAHILTDPRVKDIALVLETPSHEGTSKNWDVWKKEIEVLNSLSLSSSTTNAEMDGKAITLQNDPIVVEGESELERFADAIRGLVQAAAGEEDAKKEKAKRRKIGKTSTKARGISKKEKQKMEGSSDDDSIYRDAAN